MILSKATLHCWALSRISIASRLWSCSSSLLSLPVCTTAQTHNVTLQIHQRQFHSTTSPAAAPTAQLVKQLREATGAPMMECKKALSSPEVNNNIQNAQEWLRKHGSAKASSKVTGREALEGLVGIQITGEGRNQVASMVKVASETDFASRSEVFSTFVQEVADAAAAATVDSKIVDDIPTFISTAKNYDGKLLSERLNDVILAIRENLQVHSISLLKASSHNSVLVGYVHGRVSPGTTCGSAASLVELEVMSDKGTDTAHEAAKKLAMHIVAAKPLYLNPHSVPEDVIQKEKKILMENIQGMNKPPKIQEKIIAGQLRKFYEGTCLTEQLHMAEEGNPKISKVMKGLNLEVKGFRLMGMSKS